MSRARIMLFASGTKTGGGSGFRNLVEATRVGLLDADIVGVMSNHFPGGVLKIAQELGVPFYFHYPDYEAKHFVDRMKMARAEWAVLCGFNKPVIGLDPRRTINVHPAPLPDFGGRGMYGLRTHRAVLEAFGRGEITRTEVCMHFVTEKYDDGPVFFRNPVALRAGETAEQLQERVKGVEQAWMPYALGLVTRGLISWDGSDPQSLTAPTWYGFR